MRREPGGRAESVLSDDDDPWIAEQVLEAFVHGAAPFLWTVVALKLRD
jgi:hypothetical protein